MRKRIIRGLATLLAVVLTAKMGTIKYGNHRETWYNLPMDKVIERTDAAIGMTDLYWVREDGVKMYSAWVIVAAHPSVTRYSFVETSLGQGVVLDYHTVNDPNLYDIATTWSKDK
jgi:hypothetical protein